MAMHVIADLHSGEKNQMPHQGIERASVLHKARICTVS